MIVCTVALGAGACASAATPPSNLTGGQTLAPGQAIESPDGQYVIEFTSAGNLEELYSGTKDVLWTTSNGAAGDHALLQPNGDLVLVSSSGQTLWSSNTAGTGCPSLDLQADGSIVLYGPAAAVIRKGLVYFGNGEELKPGWILYAPSGAYYLEMEPSGDLGLFNDEHQLLWDTATSGTGNFAAMQGDGNLVVYSPAGKALWSSGTHGNDGALLTVQGDGNAVIYSATTPGKALWSSRTNGAANNGTSVIGAGPAGSATPCPTPVAAPPPTAAPAPAPATPAPTTTIQQVPVKHRRHHVAVSVRVKWHWDGAVTTIKWVKVGAMPRGAHFMARYEPKRGHSLLGREASNRRQLRALVRWLEHKRYRAGGRLTISVTHSGEVPERAQFRMRNGKEPKRST